MDNLINFNVTRFQKDLILWFELSARQLPWRENPAPYKTFLSEIILQQTRVDQGTPYYLKFLAKYPTVVALANASEDEIFQNWQGLGYYSRAKNLHAAAKQVVNDYNGIFPNSFEELLKLKGVGNYTASAIISIGYNKKYAVLDGNVYRVISRLFEISTPINSNMAQKEFQAYADTLISPSKPGIYNESIMELGALICTPKLPKCEECPVATFCQSYKLQTQNLFPYKLEKAKKKFRYLNFLFLYSNNNETGEQEFFIRKRIEKDIWQNLWSFPLMESFDKEVKTGDIQEKANEDFQLQIKEPVIKTYSLTHQLTHRTLLINFYEAKVNQEILGFKAISLDEVKEYGFPKPIELFLKMKMDAGNRLL